MILGHIYKPFDISDDLSHDPMGGPVSRWPSWRVFGVGAQVYPMGAIGAPSIRVGPWVLLLGAPVSTHGRRVGMATVKWFYYSP